MLFASIQNEIKLPAEYALLINAAGLCLLFVGIFTYRKMLRRVGTRGGLVRSDLLGLPDTLITATLVLLLLLLVVMQWVLPAAPKAAPVADGPGHPAPSLKIIYDSLAFALPIVAILALLIARGVSTVTLFGLKRVGLVRALGTAVGLLLLLLPLLVVASGITSQLLGGHSEPQSLVKTYQDAAKAGRAEIVWQVMISAVIIAPITEEILFRGYFYPTLKRIAGPLPAALGISLLFGAVHVTALGFPVLTILALSLTLSYEWSGSLLVPMFMHAWFNAANLLLMWWQASHGSTP